MASSNSSKAHGRLYWVLKWQSFFRQRIFAALSFLLLDNRTGGWLRCGLLRLNGATVGRRCFVRGGLLIQESFNLVLGNDVFSNAGCCLDLSAPITLVGARAVILPGVTIGAGAVVAAGALVTKDVPPDTLAAGVPAKSIRDLD